MEYRIEGATGAWEVVIGLEVHAQVVSNAKLFSGAATAFGAAPNSQVSLVDAAFPGMLTGCILGISRAAGETAAIMFTAAVFFTRQLPSSLLDPVMALPYHIYVLATAGTQIELTRPLQYGTALVLIALVFSMNLIAIFFRARLQRRF